MMIQRLLILVGVITACAISLPPRVFADSYSEGVAAYQAGNYARATQLLRASISTSKDPNAVFYLGMAYTHLQQYDSARQAFDLVVQMVPPDQELAVKARNNISYLTKQQITQVSNGAKAAQILNTSLSSRSSENYLTHIIPSGKVIHFSLARMPLKVYIADAYRVQGWNVGLKQAVLYAMRTWQTALHSKVSFSQTYNEANADIIVRWKRNFADNLLGVSPFQMMGNTIIRSDIYLAVYYPDGQNPIPLESLKGIAVHELGHAMGIQGHSPYPNDIMFFSNTRQQNTPSQRDINTMRMLYQLDADVQNNTNMSTSMAHHYYELYNQGLKAQLSNHPSEAMAFYRQALELNHQLPEAKFNLGALLINEGNKQWKQGDLLGAKRNLEEADHLYSELLQNGQAPKGSQGNLEVARNNLSVINKMLPR